MGFSGPLFHPVVVCVFVVSDVVMFWGIIVRQYASSLLGFYVHQKVTSSNVVNDTN